MSFSSLARKSCLDERTLSFSGDVLPRSLYDESDVPQHTRDVDCYMWSQGNRVSREDETKIPKAYSTMENGSPDSRCGQESDDELLQRVKEVDSRFLLSSGNKYELSMLRDKRLSSHDMFQVIQHLTEDRKKLAHELSSQIKARVTERSQDWSEGILKFQSEEERLHERVRELAEQNISFQREVTFLEANKADASAKVANLRARLTEVTEERDHLGGYLKDKEDENRALHKVIARLQMTCNEQERTITSLRQGYRSELDKSVECSSDKMNKLQMELIGLTGVERKLRGEVRSCHLEVESLRHENIALLNRLQSAGNGSSIPTIGLNQELQAIVDKLQTQGLFV
ncbi:hypothetical protein EJB05_20148 [Eragrostis curvula]|uniref:DUF7653 domain-containing protein n=1 Tax=Eragrostis curvula TaxID=38414 RepID=A0A5J9UZE4_9POAL|nr:hypothetical protein EJB05_20148 [Eragrostis curvula]